MRPGCYKGKAAILTVLFRHSLTHTDELRRIIGAGDVGWRLSYGQPADHMDLIGAGASNFGLHFDTTTFYEDLVAVCRKAQAATWGDAVMRRYNDGWLTLDLDAKSKPYSTEKHAIDEIAAL